MSGARTRTIVLLTALVFCMASLLVGAYADTRDTAPSENTVINYPAYPLRGAPYIVAATYNPAGSRIVLVFNEDVNNASTDTPAVDFVSATMTLAAVAYGSDDGDNVLYLTNLPPDFDPSGVETLAMRPGALYDNGLNVNTDITPITIGDGPVITNVVITDRQNDLNNAETDPDDPPDASGPNDNTIRVTFDDPVQFASGQNEDSAFGGTIEFNGQPIAYSMADGNRTIVLRRDALATGNFLYMHPGVMNVRLAAGTVRWISDAVNNAALTFRASTNDGPMLNAVYYNDDGQAADDDVMAIVFDQPVTGSFPITPVTNLINEGGSIPWGLNGGTVGSWFSTDWTNVLRASGFTFEVGPGLQTTFSVSIQDNNLLWDHQGHFAIDASPAQIYMHFGLGIVRAAYDRKLSPSNYDDDQLYIYLSEPLTPASIALVEAADGWRYFTLEGFSYGDNPSIDYLPPGSPDQFPVIVITNFTRIASPNPWEPGDRLIPTHPEYYEPPLEQLVGAISGEPLHDNSELDVPTDVRWVPVVDESRPCQLALTDTHEELEDAWSYDLVNEYYTIYLRFSETVANGGAAGLEDSDQYFLFAVRSEDESLWDKTKMATYLGAAIPLGNLRARQIDLVHRIALPVSVLDPNPHTVPPNTLYQTVDGFDIEYPGQLSFLLAAADWQGNVARVETLNPDEFGWTWLHPQPQNPNLRVYVQPEYCSGLGIETGEVRLYGLHFIHDYEVDRVRFEWLKEEGTADQCDDDSNETWETIATVGGLNGPSWRGDPVIYRDNTDDMTDGVAEGDDLHDLRIIGLSRGFTYPDPPQVTDVYYSYYDADHDGIYSARDAVVWDKDWDDKFDDAIDAVQIGSDGYIENIPDQAVLTRFTTYDNDSAANPAYYWVDVQTATKLTSSDWIFRENRNGYEDNGNDLPEASGLRGLNLWQVNWMPCTNPEHGEDDGGSIGYSGEYLVRCIAIDRSGNEDVIDQHCYEYADDPPDDYPWNPNEIQPVSIDCSEIAIDLTTVECYVPTYECENSSPTTWSWTIVELDLDTTIPIVDQVPPGTRFLKINAEPDVPADEVLGVRFFGNLWGNVVGQFRNWNGNFSPNPDGDTYADLDMVPGYQYHNGYADYLDDERIDDANGNFIFDAGDVVLDMGRDGVVSTPVGQLLVPLVLEDWDSVTPGTPVDNDNDGNVLDSSLDDDMLDPLTEYSAFWDLSGATFGPHWTGTINAFVARERPACPAGLQTDTDTENIEFDNWSPPLVDVIRVENEDDEVIDVWHPVADGDEYGIYGPDPTPGTDRTWLVHVTAEDLDGIAWVRLWYRVNPACGGTPTPWMCVKPNSFDLTLPPWDEYPDETYPYEFHWLMGALDDVDANYQFYAEAMDNDGNLSGIPVYPYGFGFNQYAGIELAHIVPIANADRCEEGPLVNVGDEYLLTAELDDPTMEGDVQVRFYYAPRIQGEVHTTDDIDELTGLMPLRGIILDPTNGGLVVCVNGSEYSDAYYTAFASNNFITFTTPPPAGAEITVSYNILRDGPDWRMIAAGDDVAPYTVEWEEGIPGDPSGVPPFPAPGDVYGVAFTSPEDGKPAWDLCAVALIDIDGDGVYDPASLCDLMEPIRSEDGNHIILNLVQRPIVHLYGLDYEPDFATGGWHYTQQEFWPGNPFGPSIAGNAEGKLSGKETDVFVTASAAMPAVIDSVRLAMYKEFHSEPYKWIPMTLIETGDEFTMRITMYTEDYYEVRPEEIENVELRVWTWPGGAPAGTYPMTEDADGHYYADATLTAGGAYRYEFFVDKIGDDYGVFADRRNQGVRVEDGKAPIDPFSLIVTPTTDFWFAHLTADDFEENTIYRTKVEAFDSNLMVGTNMADGSSEPQGPIVYVYDTTPPNIARFWADPPVVPGAGANPETRVWLEATDLPNIDVNVITTRTVVFQYSATEVPDEWITFGIDRTYNDGWFADMKWYGGNIPLPTVDNYDNDGDGEVDEADEAVTDYPVRAVVFDDAGYAGDPTAGTFPGSGNPIYAEAITVYFDGIAPYTHIIDPHDGSVFTFGVTIPITGLANDTAPEAAATPGIKSVRFQYKDGRAYWVDHDGDGYYQHGVDDVFIDTNGNGAYQAGTDILRYGTISETATGNPWFDIDPTPMDNTDDPIIINFGDPNEDTYTIDFDTRQMWSTEDSYVHLRMLATDTAGNETVKDPLHAEEIVIILDDATAPVAFLQWLATGCAPTCRYLCGPEIEAFRGTVTLYGKVLDPTHWDLSRVVAVDIEIRPEGTTDWTVLGRDQTPFLETVPGDLGCAGDTTTGQFFTYTWDTEDPWPEGVYELRAVAIDDDGNSFPEDALIVKVRIDRTPPRVYYEGTGFPGFVESLEQYYDDGTTGTSPVIKRDPDTGDVEFFVFTPDDDIRTITLQWRYPTDPIGMWRPWSEAFNERNNDPAPGRLLFQDFQYEPALNFGANRVWTAHADDWFYETDPGGKQYLFKSTFKEGPIEWRVLATDLACNTNAAVEDFVTAAVDLTCPTVCDYSVDKPTRRVVPGETMNFRVCVQDAVTDVRHVTIQAVVDAGLPTEEIYVVGDGDLLPVVEGTNVFDLDGYNTQWWFEAAWAFPDVVYKDTKLDIYIVRTDPAGNLCRSDVDDIYVQDLVPPDRTKIVVIANRTTYTDDPNDGVVIDGQDLNRLQDNDNIWVNRDASEVYDPFNGNPNNLDYLISEGALHGVENNDPNSSRYYLGDTEATYPRWVDEGYMGNAAANPARLARTVTLVARTWVDDQSFGTGDDGVAKVTFLVRPVGGTAVVLGKDEYQPFYPLYLWHTVWNTREVATDGVTPLWPDGDYEIAAYGEDLSHNVEDINSLEWTRVTVDNTAPKPQMDADLDAAGFQDRPPTDIERNSMFTLFAVISPENPLNDDAATFYIKRARDLNMPGSWLAIPAVNDPCTLIDENWGWGPEDGNPDDTRPYSFDLNLTKAMDPVEYLHWRNDPTTAPQPGPLHVGEEYDFVAAGHDLLNNTFSHIDAFADTSPKRSIRFKVVDTIAPVMTITQAKRNIGDVTVIDNPDKIYAQSFEYLQAKNLAGDVDLEDVFFVYREQGTTSWTLLDGTLTEHSPGNWRIGPWDVRALKHNTWYEVAAIGVDDVGNQSDPDDADTPKVLVYVDFDAPDNYAFTQPADGVVNLCDWYVIPEATNPTWRYYDLKVTDADAVENVDTWKIEYYYKLNSTIDTGLSAWTRIDTSEHPVIHDDATNSWWVKWDIHSLSTELYDIAARVMDVAGNETLLRIDRLGYDATVPTPLAITNIEAITAGAPDIEFHPDGWTDIAAGVEIRIWASAKDDEYPLPEDRETAVATMQFYATIDNGTTWMDLGTITPTPNQGDPTDYAGSVDWNTTGIPVGTQLWVGVIATDECGNETSRVSYRLRITDIVPPTARIIAFDPDLEPHGEYPPTCVKIYALAESDPTIASVIFQYDTIEGPNDLDHEWVNIGVGQKLSDINEPRTTEVLWWTALKTSSLPAGITQYWLRALAKDEKGNRYGDDPTDVVPTMMAELETLYDGSITFKPIRTAVPEVEDVSIQVESMTNAILTVKMASAMDHPRVVVLGESYYVNGMDICNENDYYWIYSANVPTNPEWDGDFGLVRSLNDPTVWRGEITLDTAYNGTSIEECLKFHINVTGTDAGLLIDHADVWINEYPISSELGTNGTVQTDAYGMTDAHKITVVSGAWRGEDVCLLASQTVPPTVDSDQGIYLAPVAKSAYHMQITKGHNDRGNFQDGYHPLVEIKYDQAAVDAVLSDGVTEEMLTVRKWGRDCRIDPTGETWKWIGDDISHIHVDPVNNILSFRVGNLDDARERWGIQTKSDEYPSDTTEVDLCYRGNIFQIFAPKSSAPVFVFSVTPFSEYRSGWWTDADPVFTAYLNDVGGQGIDPTTVQVKIDGNLVATFDGTGPAQWYWGNGNAYLWQANAEGTVYELDYSHSTLQRDWLAERTNPLAPHIFTVEYRTIRGTHELVSVDTPFWVDQTPPTIEFHGGWVSNPLLRNIRGYIAGEGCGPGPMDCMLTVRMTDTGSGIFVRPHRQEYLYDHDADGWIDPEDMNADPTYECGECADWIAIDWGIHYDLWRVDGEDEQADIDEFEERELLHQGTADELLPYIQRQVGTAIYDGLAGYNPETDKLLVRLPIVGGGRIADKDIIEVTIYSEKYRTLLGEGPAVGCDVIEEIEVNGETMYILSDCWFDFLSQQRIIYTQGVLDQVRNSGSAYVEQRFIVDMTPPTCVINLPGATMTPAEQMPLDISVVDDGVGASNSVTVKLTGPVSRDTTLTVVAGRATATLAKPAGGWPFGEYTVSVTSSDLLGQKCTSMKTVRVENPVLTLTDAHCYPNPFNPADGDANISFVLSRRSDVTVKVYDFAGNYVTTLMPGPNGFAWGGTAADGTKLANGAYIVRVTATDGARTETANVKVVLWRE